MLSHSFLFRFGIQTIFLLILISTLTLPIFAASGDLDPTFGNGGKVFTPVNKFSGEFATSSAIQTDGKIVVGGITNTSFDNNLFLSRINPDGSLDTTFGINGVVGNNIKHPNIPIHSRITASINSVAIQTDGKIVAAGSLFIDTVGGIPNNYSAYFFIRLNTNGTFDSTFASNGIFVGDSSLSTVRSILLQTDGKIVGVGDFQLSPSRVVRLNSNGTLDTDFGDNHNGIVTILDTGSRNFGYDIAIQPDNKIVFAGYNNTGFVAARLNPNGTFDNTFDSDGRVLTTIGSLIGRAYTLSLQTDGKIVLAGNTSETTGNRAVIVRYNTDGSLDTSFDGDGIATPILGTVSTRIFSSKIQSNGKILIAGYSADVSNDNDFLAARFNSDGSFDTTFDGDGKVTTQIGNGNDFGRSINIQTDNKIVLAGYASLATSSVSLARYNNDGSLDSSFDNDGITSFQYGNGSDVATSVALQADGKTVVGGYVQDFRLARYNIDGTLDITFGIGGIVASSIGTTLNILTKLLVQTDGKILAVGYTVSSSGNGLILVRYNSDGSFDQSFGTNGVVLSNRGSGDAIALQTDGKIIVSGQANQNFVGNSFFITSRFNSDGSIDGTFGTNGEVNTSVLDPKIVNSQRASGVKVQTDGKIVVVGSTFIDIDFDTALWDIAVIRYNSDGSLDTSFDDDGFLTTDINNQFEGASDVEIQADGKIVVSGYEEFYLNNGKFLLLRFNANGSADSSFGSNGVVIDSIANGGAIKSISLQTDGKIIAGGTASSQNRQNFALARYNSNGSLDQSFGTSGIVINDLRGYDDEINEIALQNNGKIVAVGYSNNGLNLDFAIARYSGNATNPIRTPFDFDGDGKSDISVYRPSEGNWYLLNSNSGFAVAQWGNSTDRIVPADFDGDGKADLAVFRPSEGNWYIYRSSDNQTQVINFGMNGDIPTGRDFDGDGKSEIAVFRPGNGTWYTLNLVNSQVVITQFGLNNDVPIASDFDGDGKADLAVYRPSNGVWYILQSSNSQARIVKFGIAEDKPVIGDFDGDGKTDIAVWRPSTGVWYRINSSNNQVTIYQFGLTGDIPSVGDFDGDSKSDITVFRPSNGVWYRLNSGNNQFDFTQFGLSGDKPIPSYYVP